MGDVDRQSADNADRGGQRNAFGYAHRCVGPQVAGQDQPRVLEWNVGNQAPPVVARVLQLLHYLVRRIAAVGSVEAVQRRDDGDRQQSGQPEDTRAEQRDEPPGDERGQRNDQSRQPQALMRVAPLGMGCRRDACAVLALARRTKAWLTSAHTEFLPRTQTGHGGSSKRWLIEQGVTPPRGVRPYLGRTS